MLPIPFTFRKQQYVSKDMQVPARYGGLTKLKEVMAHYPMVDAFGKSASDSRLTLTTQGAPDLEKLVLDGTNMCAVLEGGARAVVFAKVVPRLPPYEWMRTGDRETALHSFKTVHNPAYVDAISATVLSYLTRQSLCPAFCETFGTFSAVADTVTLDITDDLKDMMKKKAFRKAVRSGCFTLLSDGKPIMLEDEESGSDRSDGSGSEESGSDRSDGSGSEESGSEDSGSEESGSDWSEESERDAYIVFPNVPVQVILQEKCDFHLFHMLTTIEKKFDIKKWSAWLFQIAYGLMVAQKAVGFYHNDLHTENIMCCVTKDEFLEYSLPDGRMLKVPTYGYVMKIIDFGRSILTVQAAGLQKPKVFMSEEFAVKQDAEGQYNWGPHFLESLGEPLAPNPSFDLTYLALHLDEILDKWRTEWPLISSMLINDEGECVIDLYDGFDMCKAIAKSCHHPLTVPSALVDHLATLFS
jgi:hypothetical protein